MQQNIYSILLYSLCALIIYYICPKKNRSIILFVESLIFYAICDWKFLVLILAEIVISYFFVKKINKKKAIICVFIIVIFLCIFKYFNFFIDCFSLSYAHIILPLGISYFSFKIISYILDVYSKKRDFEPSYINYAVYVLFFPQLICGPIVRSTTITEQIKNGLSFDSDKVGKGIVNIVYGLFMKTVIADRCGGYVNLIFNNPDDYPSLALLLALCLYAIQLYCDFAGYSLIAQGLTNCFGFDCISNFKRPYLSVDIKDFWRRWHISLSSWLRDYIYIPLGGSRCKTWKIWRNVFITFIVCGIWHGSNLHFIFWGAYHGLLNNLTPRNKKRGKVSSFVMWFITLMLVLFGWLLFRADSVTFVINFIKRIIFNFSVSYSSITGTILPFTGDNTAIAYALTLFFMIGLLFIKEICDENREKKLAKDKEEISISSKYTLFWISLFFILTVLFGITGTSNFLYANF